MFSRLSPRWRKLLGDLRSTRGRLVVMVLALAVGIFGVGTLLNAYTLLTREMSRNYLGTHPASATLELDRVDSALVDAVRQRPEIAAAEASSMVSARLETTSGQWVPLLLFIVPDFGALSINTFKSVSGAWPPPSGTVLLEREALRLFKLKTGDVVQVQTPHGPQQNGPQRNGPQQNGPQQNGAQQSLTLSGVVHDAGLAPAGQEQMAYGYATPATLERLGEGRTLHLLKVIVKNKPLERGAIERTVSSLAQWLRAGGRTVEQIQIPPPALHPHQTQMTAILTLFLLFSGLALILSAILTATLIGGLLAQQVRQIGVMKAIGARTGQIAHLYLVMVVSLGLLAAALGVPAGVAAGRGFAGIIAELLNFTIYSDEIPAGIVLAQVAIGVLIPVLVALVPILNATRVTVREAISDFGTTRKTGGSDWLEGLLGNIRGLDRTLILAIRNTFRRRGRTLLTLSLLAAAGAMFMTSLNVKAAWADYLAQATQDRHYDLEVKLQTPQPEAPLLETLKTISGVQQVEIWNSTPAAPSRPDGLVVVGTYPDGGHGSFALRSSPPSSKLVDHTLLSGRWLRPDDTNAVVLNHTAHAIYFPTHKVGDFISLSLEGHSKIFKLVGIARERITPASAYTTPQAYARALGLPEHSGTVRIVMTAHDAQSIDRVTQSIESTLERTGSRVSQNISASRLDSALNGHVYILIYALMLMSLLMAVVGTLGLTSAMSTGVTERTREFGIMRTIGGRSGTVLRNVIFEGVFIGLMSWAIAVILALPLSKVVGALLGNLAFRTPLELVFSASAVLIWLLLIVVGAVLASAFPAQRASKLTIRETLAYV